MLGIAPAAEKANVNKILSHPSRCSDKPCWTSEGRKDESHPLLQYSTNDGIPITLEHIEKHPVHRGLDPRIQVEKPHPWSTSTIDSEKAQHLSEALSYLGT